jgi:hypothetical protein
MSFITVRDLAHSSCLDFQAMTQVRGGGAWGPDVKVNVTLNQQIAQYQNIGVNVLNDNGVIGAGFIGPSIAFNPKQWARNEAVLPGL